MYSINVVVHIFTIWESSFTCSAIEILDIHVDSFDVVF